MIVLSNTTGSERADTVLRGILGVYEAVFPGRVRGYYLEGSYADGIGIATSDIDLEIVFKDELQDDERGKARQIGESCALLSAVELDCAITDEQELSGGVVPMFKKSIPVYGEDIRATFSLISLDKWTSNRMHAAYWLTINIYHRPESAIYPLAYPDPAGEFYGYDNRKLRLPDGNEVDCTRNLVRTTGWIASALLAFKAGKMLATKRECFLSYHECLETEDAQLLHDIYEQCRQQWNYLIPEDAEDRKMLRTICARTLAFENRFLAMYKQFLLSELSSRSKQHIQEALRFLSQNPFLDDEIEQAVRRLTL